MAAFAKSWRRESLKSAASYRHRILGDEVMRPTDLGRISDCGWPSIAQCLNLEHEFHHSVSKLCILGFDPLK
jgi:hypothetical protein